MIVFIFTMHGMVTLHVDHRPEMILRSRLFGHPGVIIPFSEGVIAKRRVLDEEFRFYRTYSKFLPSDLVPEVAGICDDVSPKEDLLTVKISRKFPEDPRENVLLLKDLTSGYKRPSVLDIKLGIRTWALGAAEDKVARHQLKCRQATTATLRFRVRAALWRSEKSDQWPCESGINYVTREFGNTCTKTELRNFLADFLRHDDHVNVMIRRLADLKNALIRLRIEADVRMFSSSVLMVYDDADPSKVECRLLDFAKTYFDIKKKAEQFHEKLEDCEDGVVPALTNLIEILKDIAETRNTGVCL